MINSPTMAWSSAFQLIKNINKNRFISDFRVILQIPPYVCKSKRYNYFEEGFEIKIGKSSKVKIPVSMLKACYSESVKNNNVYSRDIFTKLYPLQLKDHACHVHVIGQIFLLSGVAELIDKHTYKINV